MKRRKKTNKSLLEPTKEELDEIARNKKSNPVIAIKTGICEKKSDCPLCTFKPYYGVELVFILFYANKSIQTVCYKCGKHAAEETGLKLPMTLKEIEYIERAKDREVLRKALGRERDE